MVWLSVVIELKKGYGDYALKELDRAAFKTLVNSMGKSGTN